MLTRKHPPSIGGMQQLSYRLVEQLRSRRAVTVIAWGGGQWALPFFFVVAFLRLLHGLLLGRIAVLHLGDPALAALAWLPRLAGIPVAVTVHGLDVTFPNRAYQAYLQLFFWRHMDAYLCISRHVSDLVIGHGIEAGRVQVIPVGVAPAPAVVAACEDPRLAGRYPVLLSLGRLVERKGLEWFLDEVAMDWLPRNPQAVLLVAGEGPLRERLEGLVNAHGLSRQVLLLGGVAEARKWQLLARADLVLMPNVAVPGDAEGFGMVALEAASVATWVAVADLEGLRDAVEDGVNGTRIAAGDAGAWLHALDELCVDREALHAKGACARLMVADHFGWPAIGDRYQAVFQALESHAH